MRKLPAVMCNVLAAAVFLFALTGCPQEPAEEEDKYAFDLNTAEYQYYTAGQSGFVASNDISVRITNTGNQKLEKMVAALTDDEMELFSLGADENNRITRINLPDLEVGSTVSFKVYAPKIDWGYCLAKPSVIIGNNATTTRSFQITYGVFNMENATDLTFSTKVFFAGDTVTVSSVDKPAEQPWVIGGAPGMAAVASQEEGNIKLLGTGDVFVGYIASEAPPTMRGQTISIMEKGPLVTSFTQTDNVARIVFDKAVNVDPTKILVKTNDIPRGSQGSGTYALNKPSLDLFPTLDRTWPVASAVKIGDDGTTWDLTLWEPTNAEASPRYGDILRLGIPAIGGASSLGLSAIIPEIILKNPVQRMKGAFESEAGLYRNGNQVTTITPATPDKFFQECMKYLSSVATMPRNNDVIHIVLEGDQNFETIYAGADANLLGIHGYSLEGQFYDWVIVTKKDGLDADVKINVTGTYMMNVAGSLTYVVEDGIIFDGTGAVDRNQPMFHVEDGGRFILDGGEINNFHNSADNAQEWNLQSAFAVGGGSWGAYLIINDGKISGNKVTTAAAPSTVGASTITTRSYGWVFMHGGEITNNTVEFTGAAANMTAGAICSGNSMSMRGGFYMTGGEIYGNKVTADGPVASAGGVLISGAFQKTGGNIYGSDAAAEKVNSTAVAGGNVKASAVVVINAGGPNPADAWKRDKTSAPADYLFVDSYKPSSGSGVNSLPLWWGGALAWD